LRSQSRGKTQVLIDKSLIATSFGCDEAQVPPSLSDAIDAAKLTVTEITGSERDSLILDLLSAISEDSQVVGVASRTKDWERGWSEHMPLLPTKVRADCSPYSQLREFLTPRFVRANKPIRWAGRYCSASSEDFEAQYQHLLRMYIFEKFFSDVDQLYEFGSGTGLNLLHANEMFPKLPLFGTDFVQSSIQLQRTVAKRWNIPLEVELFDMTQPSSSYRLAPGSGVLTFGALEQLGSSGAATMIEWLVDQRPDVVVSIEPEARLYDLRVLEDYLAHCFQTKRSYSSDILTTLEDLKKCGLINLIQVKRLFFGSLFMEGYNLFVWSPRSL
jgi:hypothetical protein